MAFIKVQNLKRSDDGAVINGTAAVSVTEYDASMKGRSRHKVRENLGKIVWLSEDKKDGIFLSPSRGLIEYSSVSDAFTTVVRTDKRVAGLDIFPEPEVHTVFGDVYLLLSFMKKNGILPVLRKSFPSDEDYERLLCHLLHDILRNGSRISCGDFIMKSFVSHIFRDVPVSSLDSDTAYFTMMGDDKVKRAFFRNYVESLRKIYPGFGKGCYVDSTPLPNDIRNNPFNALCSHGITSTSNQTRLALVLDEATGLPVWYTIIPGNVLDFSTISNVMLDVNETIDIQIISLVLDAGYVSQELINMFNIDSDPVMDENGGYVRQTMIARMPAKNGYPYKQLYEDNKKLIYNAKYSFIRESHTYFGIRREVEIFGKREYAYVYVDKGNALELSRENRLKHPDEYEKLSMKDKNWYAVKFGYFVLVSNKEETPAEMLDEYFSRTHIETVFKAGKEYLHILPLKKWTTATVMGKILSDMISLIIYLSLRKGLESTGIAIPRLLGQTQSLICLTKSDGTVLIDTPNKQVKSIYKEMKIKVPSSLTVKGFTSDVLSC